MRDQDTIRRFDLLTLSADDYWIILKNGVFIAILAYIVAGFLAAGTSTESWFYLSMPPVVGVLYSLGMIWVNNRRLTPAQRARLTRQRDLTLRRQRMQAASDEATADWEAALAKMAKLRELVTRMAGIQPDAVAMAEQAAGLERVIRVLDDRIRADRELITKYDLESQMLAVEIEALDIILGDAEGALAVRLAELEALEEEIEESDRRRSAELELERFLGEVAA